MSESRLPCPRRRPGRRGPARRHRPWRVAAEPSLAGGDARSRQRRTTWGRSPRSSATEVQGEEPWGDARRRRLPKKLVLGPGPEPATTAKKLVLSQISGFSV